MFPNLINLGFGVPCRDLDPPASAPDIVMQVRLKKQLCQILKGKGGGGGGGGWGGDEVLN